MPERIISIINKRGEFILVPVRKDAINFVVDNGMQYLVYKTPNYGNWVTDDILNDYGKLQKYLDTHSQDKDYNTNGCKLPEGKWELIEKELSDGLAVAYHFNIETTLVLRKI